MCSMKKRDDTVYLNDMLDAIRQIEQYMRGLEFQAFSEDKMRQDAVVRRFQVIGEAARNISPEFQQAHPNVPWSEIIGMRHKVIHDYFEIDLETIWDTVYSDLPSLEEWIERTLAGESS